MKLGHENIAHQDMDLESMGQNLLDMRGESFTDISASLGNVKGLLPQVEDDEDAEMTEEEEPSGTQPGSQDEEKQGEKGDKFLDLPKFHVKKYHELNEKFTSTVADLKALQASLQTQSDEMASGSADQRETYKAEIVLAVGVLTLIEKVLDDTPDGKTKLEDLKNSYKADGEVPDAASSGSAGLGGGAHTVRRSPPIGSLQKCPHVSDVKDYAELVHQRVTKADDAKLLKKELNEKLGPWRDIIKVGKSREGQIKERRKALSSKSSNSVTKTSALPKVLSSICLNLIFPRLTRFQHSKFDRVNQSSKIDRAFKIQNLIA